MGLTEAMLLTLLACGALIIRVGLGWYGSGLSRAKNAAGAVLRNIVDLAVAAIAFWAVGAALWNMNWRLLFLAHDDSPALTFAALVFVLIGASPFAGAVAERCKFFPLLLVPAFLAGVIIPLCAYWVWNENGWLHRIGFIDIGGASVLHVIGGLTAAAGAIVVGPRSGKYNRDGSSNLIPGHSVPMASVGVLLILVGWLPYMLAASFMHGGSSRVTLNVLLAASAAILVAVMISHWRYGKPDIMLSYSGLLGGLVAITAAGGLVTPLAAVIIGAVAGLIVPIVTVIIDLIWKIDDPAGAIAIHALGGAWGILALAIFIPDKPWAEKLRFLGVELLGLVTIAAIALASSFALFLILKHTIGLRLHEDAEYDGTDLAEHDLNAYPDFQQTMIKSYHLREA